MFLRIHPKSLGETRTRPPVSFQMCPIRKTSETLSVFSFLLYFLLFLKSIGGYWRPLRPQLI